MSIPSLSLQDLQSIFFTQYSASANVPANTNQGSQVWSFGNALALMGLNIQQQLQYVALIARLATSVSTTPGVNSPAVDSFCAPFAVLRISGIPASGGVTFTAPSVATAQIVVPVGGIVSTNSGLPFTVIADTDNTAYSPALNGYPINVGSTTVTATVQCSVAGIAGNVQPGQISAIANSTTSPPIIGIGTVSNALAYTNGQPVEADTSVQARFTSDMQTGQGGGTRPSIVGQLLTIAPGTTNGVPGLTYSYGDGLNSAGSATASVVSVYVNYYGSGVAAPSSLVSSAQSILNVNKSGGITATAYAPTIDPVNVSATIHFPSGVNSATGLIACAQALSTYLNAIGLNPSGGSTAANYFGIAATLMDVANVTKIDNLLIGSGAPTVTGTSTATNTSTLTDATQSWTVNAYAGYTVSTGGSFGIIASNTSTALTVSSWVGGTPASGLSYAITATPAGTSDLTATFGNQFIAGIFALTPASP